MPYLIIYMKEYLGFSVIEYSVVFGGAIIFSALINLYLTKLSDSKDKTMMLYLADAIFAIGLLCMYLFKFENHIATLILFGIGGFIMISGNILISSLSGAIVRDYTPKGCAGKLQGVRMVFSVLLPMLIGPLIGNAINKAMNIPLPDLGSADTMTTSYIPAPEIFLAGAIFSLVIFAIIPILRKSVKEN